MGQQIALSPFFLAQEWQSVENVRLCLSTHIEKTGLLAELSFTVTIAVAFLGIFVQINTVTVYYDNVNYKEKLFSYKYCIK